MVKVTFTVDEKTVEILKRMASRFNKPQSAVFREAIGQYAERADQLSLEERTRMLTALDRMVARKPSRPDAAVDAELAEIKAARKKGGRRHPSK